MYPLFSIPWLVFCFVFRIIDRVKGSVNMYYHASSNMNITVLEPRLSEHGTPLVYFSSKRENVLVYLSNAVEKYCRESGFMYEGPFQKWGPYGFDADGIQRIEEYYPDALKKTFEGVSGYIYSVQQIVPASVIINIPDVHTSAFPVSVDYCERVDNAYAAILEAEKEGLIRITRYEELSEKKKTWLEKIIREEYENAQDHPEYRHFLLGNFPDILSVFLSD